MPLVLWFGLPRVEMESKIHHRRTITLNILLQTILKAEFMDSGEVNFPPLLVWRSMTDEEFIQWQQAHGVYETDKSTPDRDERS